jgi:hypothetical protein
MVMRSDFEAAKRHAKDLQSSIPRAIAAHYDSKNRRIVIQLSSNLDVSFAPENAEGLENATAAQLHEIEISPSGFGIHFPRLDADLYVPAILEGFSARRNGWRPVLVKPVENQGAPQRRPLRGPMDGWEADRKEKLAPVNHNFVLHSAHQHQTL